MTTASCLRRFGVVAALSFALSLALLTGASAQQPLTPRSVVAINRKYSICSSTPTAAPAPSSARPRFGDTVPANLRPAVRT